jgi:hypothetical protein
MTKILIFQPVIPWVDTVKSHVMFMATFGICLYISQFDRFWFYTACVIFLGAIAFRVNNCHTAHIASFTSIEDIKNWIRHQEQKP